MSLAEFLRFASAPLAQLQVGALSPERFWRSISEASGIPVTDELWARLFASTPDLEVVGLIRKLRQQGRVVCGTNTMEPHDDLQIRLDDYAVFDAVYASHRMDLSRPDPEFYLHVLRAEGKAPEEACFVDDVQTNVQAANSVGMDAELYGDAMALAARLALPNP